MEKKILIIYKSSTGFTKRYSKLLAKKLSCTAIEFKNIKPVSLSDFDIIIFGTRAHAGSIDGLKKLRKTCPPDILFVTGAASAAEHDVIDKLWKDNLTEEELSGLPHFYMPAGLCYEKMCFTDKMMMKGLAFMLKKKKDKTEKDIAFERQIAASYDISSEEYVKPIIDYISSKK